MKNLNAEFQDNYEKSILNITNAINNFQIPNNTGYEMHNYTNDTNQESEFLLSIIKNFTESNEENQREYQKELMAVISKVEDFSKQEIIVKPILIPSGGVS